MDFSIHDFEFQMHKLFGMNFEKITVTTNYNWEKIYACNRLYANANEATRVLGIGGILNGNTLSAVQGMTISKIKYFFQALVRQGRIQEFILGGAKPRSPIES